jgi:hypothetical protein
LPHFSAKKRVEKTGKNMDRCAARSTGAKVKGNVNLSVEKEQTFPGK